MSSRTIRLAVVGGDGIGPEVTAEALKVLRAATPGVSIDETNYDLGAQRWHRTGETLPDAVLEEIRGHDAILLGAVGDPGVPSARLPTLRHPDPSNDSSTRQQQRNSRD